MDADYPTKGVNIPRRTTDWAFMLPIVEMAANPVHVPEPLYLYEPSGAGKGVGRAAREEIIGRIAARGSAKAR